MSETSAIDPQRIRIGGTKTVHDPIMCALQVDEAVKDYGLEACLAVDAASMSAAAKVLAAGQRVTGTAQPAVEFRRAATLTELFLRTNALYRTAYMIGANITSSPIAVRPTL